MKKRWLGFAIMVCAVVTCAGCASQIKQPEATPLPSPSPTAEVTASSEKTPVFGDKSFDEFKNTYGSSGAQRVEVKLSGSQDVDTSVTSQEDIQTVYDALTKITLKDSTSNPSGDSFSLTFVMNDGSAYKFEFVGDTFKHDNQYSTMDGKQSLYQFKNFIQSMAH